MGEDTAKYLTLAAVAVVERAMAAEMMSLTLPPPPG
jgi:hypothetical protein